MKKCPRLLSAGFEMCTLPLCCPVPLNVIQRPRGMEVRVQLLEWLKNCQPRSTSPLLAHVRVKSLLFGEHTLSSAALLIWPLFHLTFFSDFHLRRAMWRGWSSNTCAFKAGKLEEEEMDDDASHLWGSLVGLVVKSCGMQSFIWQWFLIQRESVLYI